MSLLQRIEIFRRTKKAKILADPAFSLEKACGIVQPDEIAEESCDEPELLRPSEVQSKSPSAPSEALDRHPRQGEAKMGCADDRRGEVPHMQRQKGGEASVSGRTHLAASSFYGKSRLRDVERCVLRLLAAAQRKVQGAVDDPFQVFPLQEPAFKWADAHGAENLRIFSVERDADGRRSFIVSTYAAFWARYQGMLPQHRHYYEIIRQGWPCHLYFDLEYPMAFNEGVDGNQLVDTLLELCSAALKDKFNIELEMSWVVELDSTSASKFSRHIIIQIPDAAFCSNFHVGAFAKDLCEVPGDPNCADGDRTPRQELLVAKDAQGGQTLFVDGGVYTRNRAFRLVLSSKAGKDTVLRPTDRFRGVQLSHKDTFYSSLICNVQQGCRLLQCFDDAVGVAFSWTGSRGGSRADAVASIERCPNPQMGPSRHPDIEAFITSMCTQGGVQGQVRSWVDWPEAGLLLLNMRGNRWCGNIARAHKSNGIFYVIDLQGGVWYQKCYDPECRQYRSEIMPLPPAIMQRLHADAASAALQCPADPTAQLAQTNACRGSNAMAQGPLVPSSLHVGDAHLHAGSLEHENMQPQLSGRHPEHWNSTDEGFQALDDIICASGTGIFGDSSAADIFDKELLELFGRC